MEPILAQRLVEFNLTTLQIGYFFAIWPIFYIPSSLFVQFVPDYVEKRVTIILSAFMSGIAFIFVGPSELFGFANSLVLMGIGQALVGIFTATMMIPGLPEMVESTLPKFPGQERRVNDLSSGLFNAFLGIGQVIAPLYGSTMTASVGFRLTADYVALICFAFGLIYFLFGDGVEAFGTSFKNMKNVEAYNAKVELSSTRSHFTVSNTSIRIPKLHTMARNRIEEVQDTSAHY